MFNNDSFKALQPEQMMIQIKMYNTSLESHDVQCNSKVFKFLPRSSTLVPADLVYFVYEQMKYRGIFPVLPNMSEDDKKKAYREAMITYLNGDLRERISNYLAEEDEQRKRGVTNPLRHHKLKQALNWQKEITALLEIEKPIEEQLSFMDQDKRKELGTDGEHVQKFEGESIFSAEAMQGMQVQVLNEQVAQEPARRGRPKKAADSFKDVDVGDIME